MGGSVDSPVFPVAPRTIGHATGMTSSLSMDVVAAWVYRPGRDIGFRLKTVGVPLQGLAVTFIVWGLVVLWGSCGSMTVGPAGIGQRWLGSRRTIPWHWGVFCLGCCLPQWLNGCRRADLDRGPRLRYEGMPEWIPPRLPSAPTTALRSC